MSGLNRAVQTAAIVGLVGWQALPSAAAGPGRGAAEKKPPAAEAVPSAPEPVSPQATQSGPKVVVIDEAQAREWELLIEIDLMSDSVTFPHALRCLAGEQGMEVRGYVPNTLVRERALSIARKASPMEVMSGMVVQPNLYYGQHGKLTREEVQTRLVKTTAAQGKVIEVQFGPNGQVVLSGRVASLDDKLQIGRALRGVTGCTCVKNELSVHSGGVQMPVVAAGASRGAASAVRAEAASPAPVSPYTGTRPPQVFRDGKTPSGMPPAPVPPTRQADYRSGTATTTPVVSSDDAGSPIAQASKSVPPAQAAPPPAQAPSASGDAKSAAQPVAFQASMSARSQQAIKTRLRTVLGPMVKDVELKFDGKGGVKVIVSVVGKNPDSDKIAQTIITSSELQNFDVSMEFRLE